jgi:hypothetical protein
VQGGAGEVEFVTALREQGRWRSHGAPAPSGWSLSIGRTAGNTMAPTQPPATADRRYQVWP